MVLFGRMFVCQSFSLFLSHFFSTCVCVSPSCSLPEFGVFSFSNGQELPFGAHFRRKELFSLFFPFFCVFGTVCLLFFSSSFYSFFFVRDTSEYHSSANHFSSGIEKFVLVSDFVWKNLCKNLFFGDD